MNLQCCACEKVKRLDDFSNSQQRKKLAPRCRECVERGNPIVLSSPKIGCLRRCSSCKSRLEETYPENETTCKACLTKQAFDEAERLNELNRHPSLGACRVKDVQKRYGHLCEIPIQAYKEAGVAWSRNDFVTDIDVERASAAWDARSIAHDIDTQWGTMRHGGAYSDSNYYYGPGEYDYY